jgi:hypothetical protein
MTWDRGLVLGKVSLARTDVITITKDDIPHVMRITGSKMTRHSMQEIRAVAEDSGLYEIYCPLPRLKNFK